MKTIKQGDTREIKKKKKNAVKKLKMSKTRLKLLAKESNETNEVYKE